MFTFEVSLGTMEIGASFCKTWWPLVFWSKSSVDEEVIFFCIYGDFNWLHPILLALWEISKPFVSSFYCRIFEPVWFFLMIKESMVLLEAENVRLAFFGAIHVLPHASDCACQWTGLRCDQISTWTRKVKGVVQWCRGALKQIRMWKFHWKNSPTSLLLLLVTLSSSLGV